MYRDDEITFIDNLIAMINTELSDGTVAEYKETQKNNGTVKKGVIIKKPDENIGAVYYLSGLYSEYMECGSYNAVFCKFMKQYYRSCECPEFDVNDFLDFEKAGEKIVYRLVNYEKNAKLLESVPHERVFDLALTYHYIFDIGNDSAGSILIHNEHCRMWGVDKKEIDGCARKNTPALLEPVIFDIEDMIDKKSFFGDYPMSCSGMMYVLCNEKKCYGAGCILYPHVLADFAKRIDSDFFIIPSSVHEVILLPALGSINSRSLLEMIENVNETTLLEEEILSNNAYYYEKDTEELSIVSQ